MQILLVEDNLQDAILAQTYLEESPNSAPNVVHVMRLAEAIAALRTRKFDLILLDMNLPDSRNLETVRHILEAAPRTPVVITSGLEDEVAAVDAVQAGAQDYISKNDLNDRLLRRTVRCAIERKRTEMALEAKAYYDELTGLATRELLYSRWPGAMARAERDRSATGILVVDLDGFKAINDTHGHIVDDHLLRTAADRMTHAVRGSDTVARFGGDEFVVLLECVNDLQDAKTAAHKIKQSLVKPTVIGDLSIAMRASIGIAITDHVDFDGIEAAIHRADLEMYQQKQAAKAGKDKSGREPAMA